jgi:hypothetical protein
MVNVELWKQLNADLVNKGVTLVAVSKTKPEKDISDLYALGQRDFGENYVQELCEKQAHLPTDIHWHFIGHLQSNKVKYIAPFIHLIHTVDSLKLLKEINKEALKNKRIIKVLLQVYIAAEETKFGLDELELNELLKALNSDKGAYSNIQICGLMGMATNTDDEAQVQKEFSLLNRLFLEIKSTFFPKEEAFAICSMGMSGDYLLAISCGSTMVRIGSLLFGERNYPA